MPSFITVEALESRIAPASFLSPREVRYIEADGDLVMVKSSQDLFHKDFREFVFVPDGIGERLQLLQLDDAARGSSISITAAQQSGGNGLARVSAIEANVDLGDLTVDGTLGRIEAGDSQPGGFALQRLVVKHCAAV